MTIIIKKYHRKEIYRILTPKIYYLIINNLIIDNPFHCQIFILKSMINNKKIKNNHQEKQIDFILLNQGVIIQKKLKILLINNQYFNNKLKRKKKIINNRV